MTINGVPGGIGNMSRGGGGGGGGGWSFKSLSRGGGGGGGGGLEGIIDACPGGSGTTWKIVQGGGAKQKLVQGAFTSLSLGGRGIIQACPGVFL